MSDCWTAVLISGSWVLAAIGFAYGKDAAKLAWTALKHRKASQSRAPLNTWPADVMPVCQSWLGKEISAPVIAEAEGIAEKAWYAWKPERVEESEE